jgi:hypothetical protein
MSTTVQPAASTATPDPRDQSASSTPMNRGILNRMTDAVNEIVTGQPTRTWERIVGETGRMVETCPAMCEDTHITDLTATGVDDLTHGYRFDGPQLPVFDATEGTALVPILSGRVQIDPYNRDPARRRAHMNFEPFQDEVMEGVTPDGFAQIIATIRAHCDYLDEIHARFARLHGEWTETGE